MEKSQYGKSYKGTDKARILESCLIDLPQQKGQTSYQLKRIWRLSVDAQLRRRSITQLDSKEVERMQDQTTYQRKPLRLMYEFRLISFIFFAYMGDSVYTQEVDGEIHL